jgi:hypothetical protein
MKTEMWTWMRVQFFRFWTALVVLGAYGYFWLNTPEYLTWWKRTVNTLIEKGCDMLSYLIPEVVIEAPGTSPARKPRINLRPTGDGEAFGDPRSRRIWRSQRRQCDFTG